MRGGGCFSIDGDILDENYNYDFTDLKDDGTRFQRGGRRYMRPYGWKRVALNVKTRYEDTAWLGGSGGHIRTESVAREWPVSYHGTQDTFAKVIAAEGKSMGGTFMYNLKSHTQFHQNYWTFKKTNQIMHCFPAFWK